MAVVPGKPTPVAPVIPGKPTTGKPVVIAGKPITYTVNKDGARVWTGEGPPPSAATIGISVGETYVDQLTGIIYRLDPGE